MAHTYLLFDFGTDEEKAQQARHKLEGWKQAFRLDKKVQFKFDRSTSASDLPAPKAKPATQKARPKADAKSKPTTKPESEPAETSAENDGSVKLLVRLYFSAHEKLSEKHWIERISDEEPFKSARPKVVQEGETQFAGILKQFDSLD